MRIEPSVRITVADDLMLVGDLVVPDTAVGVVVFAHGSGSGRHSPRNRSVAEELQAGGLATLLLDLLTEDEEQIDLRTRHLRFDVTLLADRLATSAKWIRAQPELAGLPVGFFGASTGTAAALIAAADHPDLAEAVVSRGGRPDLAGERLAAVRCSTLFIVGANDPVVLDLNREAMSQMQAETNLEVIPGATHLFEESGALERVAERAVRWFTTKLTLAHTKPGSPT